jgi:membrane protein implicated in regulation of membrane protease activity
MIKTLLTLTIVAMAGAAGWTVETAFNRYRPLTSQWVRLLLALLAVLLFAAIGVRIVQARDLDGRYAQSNPEMKAWFEGLKSGKGPCCSDADGTALSDVDWETHEGHYRVRIEGQWWDVPEEAVIKEPNRIGRTMVWPIYNRGLAQQLTVDIRCFMPGSMT